MPGNARAVSPILILFLSGLDAPASFESDFSLPPIR
jgi:hypothetical protein